MPSLVTGANGFLGSRLISFLEGKGEKIVQTSRSTAAPGSRSPFEKGDLLDASFVEGLVKKHKPKVIYNTTGLVSVEKCQSDPGLARDLNVRTAEVLAAAAKKISARMIHVSTDHLFDGKSRLYQESDAPSPVNEYGKTKLEAEKSVLSLCPSAAVIRTNFFGWSHPGHVPTFAEWLHGALRDRKPIHLYSDYFFSSIEAGFLVEFLNEAASLEFSGVLNIASRERFSKYEFGEAMAKEFGLSMDNVKRVKFADQPLTVPRPADISLSVAKAEKIFGRAMPTLHDGLAAMARNKPAGM